MPPVESAGWDNTIYRLGAGLAVRLPRRRVGAGSPVADMGQAAVSLARFIAALQAIDATGGPVSEFRGPLAGRDRVTRAAAAALRDRLDVRPALAVWEAALAAAAWTGTAVWLHGDLHPANLLVASGQLSAVIDFGLMGVGDPACDLMVAWTYLPEGLPCGWLVLGPERPGTLPG